MAAESGPTPYGAPTLTAPALDHFSITPSNSVNFNIMARAIYVGVGGDIAIVSSRNNAVTYLAVPQGTVLPVVALRVNSTSTTASSLVGLV